jgi:hypothetical protein
MSDDTFGWLKRKLDKSSPASPDPPPSEQPPTPTIADVLTLPNVERRLVNWLVRQQSATVDEIAAYIAQAESSTQDILKELARKGFVAQVDQDGQIQYEPRLRSRRSS